MDAELDGLAERRGREEFRLDIVEIGGWRNDNIGNMRRSAAIERLVLLAAVLVLLIAPLSQAMDRHDQFTPHDTELNLCMLAVVATAGYWVARQIASRWRLRRRACGAPGARRIAAGRTYAAGPDATASPPEFSASLLRI